MSIMFVDGAEAPSTNIMNMVSPYAPGFALWNAPSEGDSAGRDRRQGQAVGEGLGGRHMYPHLPVVAENESAGA